MNNDNDDGDDVKIKAPEIMRKSCAKVDTPRRDGKKNRRKQIPKVGYIDTKFFFFFFVLLFGVDAGFFVSIFF